MKVQISPPKAWETLGQKGKVWLRKPMAKLCLKGLDGLLLGFILAGASANGKLLPLSVALSAAYGLSLATFTSYLGGCVGYITFWGLSTALEPMAAGLLVVAASCIFDDSLPDQNRWFCPLSAMLFTGVTGFLFLIDSGFAIESLWRWALHIAVAGAGARTFRRALQGSRTDRLLLLAGVCLGLCVIRPWGGVPLGAVAAAALSAAAMTTPLALHGAAVCGLAVELGWQSGAATAILMTATLLCRRLRGRWLRLGLWSLWMLVGVLVTGSDPLLFAALLIGGLLSRLIPGQRLLGAPRPAAADPRPRLDELSGLLLQLSQCIGRPLRKSTEPEGTAVFDRATERVCRLCPLWNQCWEEEMEDTLEAFRQAAQPMLLRGEVRRSDFPASFCGRCRYLDTLINAMNRELEDLSCRRQCHTRLKESRTVIAAQLQTLSGLLGAREPVFDVCRFRPELGIRGQGKRGSQLSGDRGISFQYGQWFYVILCDGMGTGQAAAGESAAAVTVLEKLLQAGLPPVEALQFLNGIYLLRDDGGFATVDLLQADLVTGQAVLHKWGGAPSYVKRRGSVETVGTVLPPPGISLERNGEGIRLSLSRGEVLVMVSDGAGGQAAEDCIRRYQGQSPKELAAAVVAASDLNEDDCMAAVLTLRPCGMV